MKRTILLATVALLSFLPLLASAQNLPNVWDPTVIKGPLVTCTGNYLPAGSAPQGTVSVGTGTCQSLCDLVFTVVSDIYIAIAFVIWILLPISFAMGGIMYMMGGANPGLLETAKKTLWGAVIGAVIVLCAYLLIQTFVTFMKINGIGGFNGTPTCSMTTP
jgi:hypothetical protein